MKSFVRNSALRVKDRQSLVSFCPPKPRIRPLALIGRALSYNAQQLRSIQNATMEDSTVPTTTEHSDLFPVLVSQIDELTSPSSLEDTFQLLERAWQSQSGDDQQALVHVSTRLLCKALNKWKQVLLRYPKHELSLKFSSQTVYSQIQDYKSILSDEVYRLIILAPTNTRNEYSIENVAFAENLLKDCLSEWQSGNESCAPSTGLCNAVLHHLSTVQHISIPNKITSLVHEMKDFGIVFDQRTYECIIQSYARNKNPGQACQWLEEMNGHVRPTAIAFTLAINSLSETQGGSKRARELLDQLLDIHRRGGLDCDPKMIHGAFNATLKCLLNDSSPHQKANDTMAFFESAKDSGFADEASYRTMLAFWSKRGEAEKCEHLLKQLVQEYRAGKSAVAPSNEIFALAISAWAKSENVHRVRHAVDLLNAIQQSPEIDCPPTTITFNALIEVLSRSRKDIGQAEVFLRKMKELSREGKKGVAPNETSYNMIISGYAKFGRSEKAHAWLNEMAKDYENGVHSCKPGLYTFNCVLGSYVRLKKPNAPHQALQLLRDAHTQYEQGKIDFCPDRYSYTSVISALSKSKDRRNYGETALMAEELLNVMRRKSVQGQHLLRPNAVAYNSVINGWARAKKPDEAARILALMREDYKEGNPDSAPNVISYNALMKAVSLAEDDHKVERVEKILDEMNERFVNGESKLQPNVNTYTSVMLCYGLAKHPDAPKRADELLDLMHRLHREGVLPHGPNAQSYRCARMAWAGSSRKDKMVRIGEIDRQSAALQGRGRRRNGK